MKKMIVILGFALMSTSAFAKTVTECRSELSQNHLILSPATRAEIHKIVKSNQSIQNKKNLTAQALNKVECVVLIADANGQTLPGIADALVNQIQAIPAGMLTNELIDTFVGMLIIEN